MTQSKHQQADASLVDSVIQRLTEDRSQFEGFLRRRVRDDSIAQDLLQQSFVKALQQHHSLKNEESVVPWFYRILRNTLIDYYRSQATDEARQKDFEKQADIFSENHVPSLDEAKTTVCACLEGVLSALRPGYADLIRRIDLTGEPLASVAQQLQITPNNATVRLHRARQALRKSLEASCGICSKHGCIDCTCH